MSEMTEHSQIVCLRLIDEISQRLNHHCSLCLFLNDDDADNDTRTNDPACGHNSNNLRISRPYTPGTDASFHTAISSPSSLSASSWTERHNAIRMKTGPPLRRRASPTHISLRDLEAEHARQVLRAKQSEEQLQHMYESQVSQYLNNGFYMLANIEE